MSDSKLEKYKELVSKRKDCTRCTGLKNPAAYPCDCDEIGQWTIWQGNFDSRVLLVGQDWGDVNYFVAHNGRDADINPTNKNLISLFKSIGIDIGTPSNPTNEVFFTNAILCLKDGGMSAATEKQWFSNCGPEFLKPLIDLISPEIVIAMGNKAYQSIATLYGEKVLLFKEAVEKSPFYLENGMKLFAVYHCGSRGVNCNRKMPEQERDWKKINEHLEKVSDPPSKR